MSKQEATALLNLIEAQPQAFTEACDAAAGEDGDGAAIEESTLAALANDAGSEQTEGDPKDA